MLNYYLLTDLNLSYLHTNSFDSLIPSYSPSYVLTFLFSCCLLTHLHYVWLSYLLTSFQRAKLSRRASRPPSSTNPQSFLTRQALWSLWRWVPSCPVNTHCTVAVLDFLRSSNSLNIYFNDSLLFKLILTLYTFG